MEHVSNLSGGHHCHTSAIHCWLPWGFPYLHIEANCFVLLHHFLLYLQELALSPFTFSTTSNLITTDLSTFLISPHLPLPPSTFTLQTMGSSQSSQSRPNQHLVDRRRRSAQHVERHGGYRPPNVRVIYVPRDRSTFYYPEAVPQQWRQFQRTSWAPGPPGHGRPYSAGYNRRRPGHW